MSTSLRCASRLMLALLLSFAALPATAHAQRMRTMPARPMMPMNASRANMPMMMHRMPMMMQTPMMMHQMPMIGHMAMGSARMSAMQTPTFLHNLNTSLHNLNTSLTGQRIVLGLERNTPLVDRLNALQDRAVLDRLAGPGLFPNPFTAGFGLNPFTAGFGFNP
jgi:hypothetical protein